jgi:hypothetical protein
MELVIKRPTFSIIKQKWKKLLKELLWKKEQNFKQKHVSFLPK